MDNNFTGMNATLISAQFDFNVEKKINKVSVEQSDEIVISKVCEHYFELIITRRLILSQINQTLAEATFNVRINTENAETVNGITEKIRNGLPILGNVFSRISLVLSQITSQSPYGPLVTIPNYNNQITVKTNLE